MFAVDHATTALLIKRRYPSVSMTPLLVSVQAMELAWVGLNYLGIERTTTEATVRSVADIHLAYMPYSHSVGIPVCAAVLVWLITEKGFGSGLMKDDRSTGGCRSRCSDRRVSHWNWHTSGARPTFQQRRLQVARCSW
jgi:hypothetical protein